MSPGDQNEKDAEATAEERNLAAANEAADKPVAP
jgi:hypothetical protein